jgi:tripeptide aminopeptidase
MINFTRLLETLLELIRIDSLSRKEGQIARHIMERLRAHGAEVRMDDAGEKVGGNSGNVIAALKGNAPNTHPILLAAHMDTVAPGEGVKPVLNGRILKSDGTTVLGGDDKSGIAIILEVLRAVKDNGLPHSDIEVVFTICEEVGLLGAKRLDVSQLRSKHGIVLDSDDVGYLFTRCPGANRMEFRVYGLAAHAGVCPERGLSAIKIASEAVTAMRLGRIDFETTANVGVVEGGLATNIVPEFARVKAEARSHSEEKLQEQTRQMQRCFEEAVSHSGVTIDGVRHQARLEVDLDRDYDRMNVPEESRIVHLVTGAARNLGLRVETQATGGGCDANILNRKGIEVANLGTGMREIHTVNEWLNLDELERAAQIVLEVVRLNAL